MAGFPVGTPTQQLVVQTNNPVLTQNSDGSIVSATSDHNGALLTRHTGGTRLAASARGNVFFSGSVVAGTVIPAFAAGTTLASKGGLINPAGSGRMVELISVTVANITNVIVAVSPLCLGIQLNPSANGLAPTAITKNAAVAASPLGGPGGRAPVAFGYSAATLNFLAAHEVMDVLLYPFGNNETSIGTYGTTATFDGEVILGPDSNIALLSVANAQTSVLVTWCWSEWLP